MCCSGISVSPTAREGEGGKRANFAGDGKSKSTTRATHSEDGSEFGGCGGGVRGDGGMVSERDWLERVLGREFDGNDVVKFEDVASASEMGARMVGEGDEVHA